METCLCGSCPLGGPLAQPNAHHYGGWGGLSSLGLVSSTGKTGLGSQLLGAAVPPACLEVPGGLHGALRGDGLWSQRQ